MCVDHILSLLWLLLLLFSCPSSYEFPVDVTSICTERVMIIRNHDILLVLLQLSISLPLYIYNNVYNYIFNLLDL